MKIPAIKTDRTASLHDGEDLVGVGVVDDLPDLPALVELHPGGGVAEEISELLREVEFVHRAVQANSPEGELRGFDLTDGAGSVGADIVLHLVARRGVGAGKRAKERRSSFCSKTLRTKRPE